MLAAYLKREGFDTVTAQDGETGVNLALSGRFAIVVLDIMMPRLSGLDALRRIREESDVPVLMLTARGDDIDRVVGLNLGADDYVPKPSSPAELAARLKAILRRTEAKQSADESLQRVTAGPLTLHMDSRRAEWQGQALELTSTEFNLLEVLARDFGNSVSKDDLSRRALGRRLMPYDRRIDVHISSIRQKLGSRSDGQSWIQTIRGQGYQLVAE